MPDRGVGALAPTAPLEGKVAIVTGASRGIGAATAHTFAKAGANVALAARDEDALHAVANEIVAAGGEAIVLPTDVTDAPSVARLVEETVQRYGGLDLAFNNAGGGHMPTPLIDLAVSDIERALRVNALGVFLSMKYEIAAMLERGGGAIVNMSSTAGVRGVKGMGGYVAAKHAVIGLTRAAALDYGESGVRVNAVAPGPILTDRLEQLDEADRRKIGGLLPLGRIGHPQEVAATVVWLCSDAGSFVTGATVPVDGGKLAQGA